MRDIFEYEPVGSNGVRVHPEDAKEAKRLHKYLVDTLGPDKADEAFANTQWGDQLA
jgi:hypothetical protein